MGLVLITHSMGVVAETAERVSVQYAGQKVEEQPGGRAFRCPRHPYTAALLAALPERAQARRLPPFPGSCRPVRPPGGSLFSPRCTLRNDLCRTIPARHILMAPCATIRWERCRMSLVLFARNLTRYYVVSRGAFREPAI